MAVLADADLTSRLSELARVSGDNSSYDIASLSVPAIGVTAATGDDDPHVVAGEHTGYTGVGELLISPQIHTVSGTLSYGGKTHVYWMKVQPLVGNGENTANLTDLSSRVQALIQNGKVMQEVAGGLTEALPQGYGASLSYAVIGADGNAQCLNGGTGRILHLKKARTDGSHDPLNAVVAEHGGALMRGITSVLKLEHAIIEPGDRLVLYDGWTGRVEGNAVGPRERIPLMTGPVYETLLKAGEKSSGDLVRAALNAYRGLSLTSPEKSMTVIYRA